MNNFIKNLKLKLLIIFAIPSIGMVYFSSGYLYDKVIQYDNTLYLDRVSQYAKISSRFIDDLQKERGLSIGYISKNSDFFYKKLKRQRERTNECYRRLKRYFNSYTNSENQNYLKSVVESYSDIESFRQKVDKKEVNIFEILDYYSNIISNLIASTNILKSKFVNEEFFRTIVAYRRLMLLGEVSGRERALITFMLESGSTAPRVLHTLIKLEMEFKQVRQDLLSDATIRVFTRYRDIIDKRFENNYIDTKHKIIFERDVCCIKSNKWWKISTKYINSLHKLDKEVLDMLMHMKQKLKRDALTTLGLSIFIWLLSILALYLLIRLVSSIINAFGELVSKIDEQKRLYQTFAEFSEILIYNDDERTILTSMCVILYQTEYFKYLWLAEKKNGVIEPFITENIPATVLKKEIHSNNTLKIVDDIEHTFNDGRQMVSHPEAVKNPLYEGIEVFGLYPVNRDKQTTFVLVIAFDKEEKFDVSINEMLGRMCSALTYAFEKIDAKEQERRLRDELRIAASAFDAHEAITVTDTNGKIVKVNKAFTEITGYEADEVIGRNTNILKSGQHDKNFYVDMWDKLRKTGHWSGEIYNRRKNGEIYPELLSISAIKDDNGEVTHYIAHFYDISDMKDAQQSAEYRAMHDPLTDLYNRQGLTEELQRIYSYCKLHKELNAFFFFDLDNFKHINDYYGHEVGDRVLQRVAHRFKELIYEGDIAARIAGDEFAIILTRLGKNQESAIAKASIFVEKLIEHFKEPVVIDDISIEVSFSIGIKIFPTGEDSYQDVIINADVAMYHAKKGGKNRFNFFDEALDEASKKYLEIKNELTNALKNSNELKIFYQPKVSISSGEVEGFEALLRWQHPKKGLLSPDQFIQATIGNTLGLRLNEYVIKSVCRDLVEWKNRWSDFDKKVSINISSEQFVTDSFEATLLDIVQNTGAKTELIELEIVEDALLKDINKTIDTINRLKNLGFTFSIDDFGTGYSSLNYLNKLPVDTLKIDKDFVLRLFLDKNTALVKMIIEIAKVFDMKTVAEGVENSSVLQYLETYGCDMYQGYLFSPPLPHNKTEELLATIYEDDKKDTDVKKEI